jgi:putative DNA primase/helicase
MKMAPVRFDPKAKCPRWEQFLREVFEAHPDVIPFLQRAVGYSLTGDVREECFFLLWGKGMNGKGTFLGTLMALLGDYAMAFDIRTLALRKIDADGPSEGIARLRGRRFVKAEEPRDEFSFNEGLLKWLTGGDRIVARRLHENSAEFDPTFKIWIATNPKPVIRSTDFAMWRRVKLIPFTVSFEDRNDPSLKRRLLDELPGILAWAIEGCLRWQEDGLQFPETVLSAIADYRREQDQVGRFLEECCVRTPTATVPARRLYEAYRQWAEGGGEPVASETIIGNRLRDKGFAKEHTWKGWQYVGIGLRTQDEGT